jgi:hypothetical protein
VSNNELIFESWRKFLNEALPGSTTRLANVRGKGQPVSQPETQPKAKQIAQKNQLPALRTKGEIQPTSKKFANELINVAKQYLGTVPKDLEKASGDPVDFIMAMVEKVCQIKNMSPFEFRKFSGDLRATLNNNRQNPEVLLDYFQQTLGKIASQGGFDVNCLQISAQDKKQIQYSV